MRRTFIVAFAVVAALLVATAPASAASTGVKINTTAADFNSATLQNLAVSGSGDSASVTGSVGYIDKVNSGGVSTDNINQDSEVGVVLNSTADRDDIKGVLGASDLPPTTAYLRYHSNGTLIASKSISGGEVVFEDVPIESGVEYRLTADDGGTTFRHDIYDAGPRTDGDLELRVGYIANAGETFKMQAFESVSAGSFDARYVGSEHDADAETVFANVSTSISTTVTAQANSGSGWTDVTSTTVSSSQNVSLDVSGSSGTQYRTVVDFEHENFQESVSLHDEGVTFTSEAPTLSNRDPPDGSDIGAFDGTVSVDVSDPDFGAGHGDSVDVSVANSEGTIGTTTLTSNGTAEISYTPLGGPNNLTWTATDEYGNTETLTHDFSAPSRLEVRNETNASELVDDVEVRIQFFRQSTDDVVTKTTSNGIISMSGLPADEPFVATAEADGYVSRRIYVDSLLDQERIYLLNESANTVEIDFEIDDSTGEFTDSETILVIEKPVNRSGSTQFEAIVGDRIGANGRLPATLEEGERYRITVTNGEQTRSLGSYTPTVSTIETLPIGQIRIRSEYDEGYVLESRIVDSDTPNPAIRVVYSDQEQNDATVTTRVVEINDTGGVVSVVAPNDTVTGAAVSRTIPITNTTATYRLEYVVERDGETIAGTRVIGEVRQVSLPIDPRWLSLFSWVFVFAIGGLVVIKDSRAAAVVMAGTSSLFGLVGWIDAPVSILGLATAGAVLWAVSGGNR